MIVEAAKVAGLDHGFTDEEIKEAEKRQKKAEDPDDSDPRTKRAAIAKE